MQYKLRKSREEVLAIAPEMVAYAKTFTDDIEFSPEDAGRSDPEFLYQVLEAAIAAGATTVNIPDTVGYLTPTEFGDLIRGIKANVPNIDQAVISVHGHNDLGLAVANFLRSSKGWRAPAGMHHQRHWRAGGQCCPGRTGDGHARARAISTILSSAVPRSRKNPSPILTPARSTRPRG